MKDVNEEFSKRGSKPVILNDKVWKEYRVDWEIEYAKALALWNLSLKENFVVPRPLSIDEQTHVVIYERVVFDAGIREKYINYMKESNPKEENLPIFFKTGEVLAEIHKGLYLSSRRLWQPTKEFENSMKAIGCDDLMIFCEQSPQAFLHCDYSFANLYVEGNDSSSRIVLFDPSPNYHTTFFPDTYGTIYVDIGVFFASLNGRISLRLYPGIKWGRLKEAKHAFLAGYEQVSGIKINLKRSEQFGYAVARNYFSIKYHSRFMRTIAMLVLYNQLKNNSIKDFS